MDTISSVRAGAEALTARGRLFAAEGNPGSAEQQYLSALKLLSDLFSKTGDRADADAAEELCLTLADLAMQQGNMHGADVFYVEAMYYRSPEIYASSRP